ncbi:hypothetical protein AGABI2DRAFT_229242 [Agaricus bisporus var. bisporus H97]|uniref:hypothetical protein n=1 Tax=Agaricus bisporus var. bisporus (strain H97 / ATCC MYA-4626 / FGSC 10389) TaxID=936046 RepID=UPI00029F59C4|nr:hypothetical protein AGABI2DRAFT_229242 [Agaricus bisporus var. bisporus H97]EKV42131.1 hypothetical protein AGABI2DRAFT_229242 [Agaricus bisporus var. bisporus H97]
MTSRHFYSTADDLVLKSLRGTVLLNPNLKLHPASRTVYTVDRTEHVQVAVMSGGGAGHEPAHAGYTGRGMLSACVSGEIFASPSSKQILNTIRLAALGGGLTPSMKRDVLVIINNYTGDRLNFGLAIEKAKVLYPDVNVASVVVSDDVSLLNSPATQAVGPRGLAGNILVCKLLGALAETGANLQTIQSYGDAVVGDLSSIGVALEHCHVPGREGNLETMADGECEIGLGLHNEAGVSRRKMGGVKSVIQEMIEMIVNSKANSSLVQREDGFVLFVNNLGGISQLEMGALLSDLVDELDERGQRLRRIYLSSFMTSLNAPGFSASLLNTSAVDRKLASNGLSINTYDLLDAPTEAHSWLSVHQHWDKVPDPRNAHKHILDMNDYFPRNAPRDEKSNKTSSSQLPTTIKFALQSACFAVLKVEKELTEYDTVAGDGDCGHTFAAGAGSLLSEIQERGNALFVMDPATLTERIADILEDKMGGTIGALFGIYLNAYSHTLRTTPSASETHKAPLQALEDLCRHTTAKPGDRTIIDALRPFCEVLASTGNLKQAVAEAISGAKRTRGMKPRLGRAAYIGKTEENYNVLDPGAWGVAKLLEGFSEGLLAGG